MTVHRFRCPGRVNLIGEHTDYLLGLALPMAIELEGVASARSRIVSDTPGVECYVRAVEDELAILGRPAIGFSGTMTSTLPVGAGLSSSAAVGLVLTLALCRVADFELSDTELILLGQRVERRATGVPCGALDQAACVFARRGFAALVNLATLTHRPVPLPDDLAVLVVHSGVVRRLEDSRYAQRRRELEAAAAGSVSALHRRRLRHFRSENERVSRVVAALEATNVDPFAVGRLLSEGHASLRDDFEVSTPELDALVGELCVAGAYGARMVGGGFGGCVVAIADRAEASGVGARAATTYETRTGRSARVFVTAPSDGARELSVEQAS